MGGRRQSVRRRVERHAGAVSDPDSGHGDGPELVEQSGAGAGVLWWFADGGRRTAGDPAGTAPGRGVRDCEHQLDMHARGRFPAGRYQSGGAEGVLLQAHAIPLGERGTYASTRRTLCDGTRQTNQYGHLDVEYLYAGTARAGANGPDLVPGRCGLGFSGEVRQPDALAGFSRSPAEHERVPVSAAAALVDFGHGVGPQFAESA